MMIRIRSTICLMILLLSFLSSCHQEKIYVQLADQEIFNFAKEIKQDYNLRLIGNGGGFLERINSLSLTFSSKQQLNIEESRTLFTTLTQNFLAQINSNENIRPYLANYPFTPKNLDFAIFFTCYPIEESNYITAVSMTDIYNFDNDPPEIIYTVINTYGDGRIVHKETYEKALELATKNCSSN